MSSDPAASYVVQELRRIEDHTKSSARTLYLIAGMVGVLVIMNMFVMYDYIMVRIHLQEFVEDLNATMPVAAAPSRPTSTRNASSPQHSRTTRPGRVTEGW